MQPASGGLPGGTPLTSFVVMSLAGIGRADHPVTPHGAEFLRDSVRDDGSWPIDTNLATWNTTLVDQRAGRGGEDVGRARLLGLAARLPAPRVHPFTGAAPGRLGLDRPERRGARRRRHAGRPAGPDRLAELAARPTPDSRTDRRRGAGGVQLAAELQNCDGGWPTFCRGWGKLPFDRSGADLTAHALRALARLAGRPRRCEAATPRSARGLAYLRRAQQQRDGSWVPLWFGNQDHPARREPGLRDRAGAWPIATLEDSKPAGGAGFAVAGFGAECTTAAGAAVCGPSEAAGERRSSVEETAVAVEALLARACEGPLQARCRHRTCSGWSEPLSRADTAKARRSVSTSPSCGIMKSSIR